ncbi:Ms4533A family Cys-rich leader peptide [Mycolicibacterium hassiacum]
MRTASGNKGGFVLALIAVGFAAVADVCCCR